MPAASRARTRKEWFPSERAETEAGEVQEVKALPSRLHSKVAAGSLEEKVKEAVVWLVGLGGKERRLVSGSVRSTRQA